jgi:hypothetical protein
MMEKESLLNLREGLINVEDVKLATVYFARWFMLLLFVLSGISNAMILLSFAPISDKATTYFNVGLTEINLLNVVFQMSYLPGTLLALNISSRSDLRSVLLCGGVLTTGGCAIRFLGTTLANKEGLPAVAAYCFVLFGTIMVGLAQPFYLSFPAKIAATWYVLSLFSPAATLSLSTAVSLSF